MPVPARITWALNAMGAEGPEVDVACGTWEGNPAGDVDAWEAGEACPTPGQVVKLAEYTGHPVGWFYRPIPDELAKPHRVFICERGRRPENALTVVESSIGWDGVLKVDEIVSPKSPYRPRKPAAARQRPAADVDLSKPHEPVEDPEAPGCCRCKRPMDCAASMHRSGRR
jgi:hypothetical protein